MSWHGTLTCSYCYEKGHTRRKCPEMKRRHDQYQQHIDDGTTDQADWYLRSAHREWKEQQTTLDENNKVCAFCGRAGHRVGTCPDRMATVQQLKELDEWFVPLAQSVLTDMGYGVGTVIKSAGYVGNKYTSDALYMVTKPESRTEVVGKLSIVQLWEDEWLQPELTCLSTLQKRRVRLPDGFRYELVQRLWKELDLPEGYDFSERSYNQREYTRANPISEMLGYLPRERSPFNIVSPMSSPFENSPEFVWNFKQKREVNRLFRDSKNSLIQQRHRYRVGELHRALKERGVL